MVILGDEKHEFRGSVRRGTAGCMRVRSVKGDGPFGVAWYIRMMRVLRELWRSWDGHHEREHLGR